MIMMMQVPERARGIHDRTRKIVHVIFIFKNLVNEENLDESQKKRDVETILPRC